ncbi:NAD(P)/FAD-dependent oxidoreductase [Nocardia sp. NPDC052278]|uniref:NAD(P)/FAD-dependent oxidoreductase n=1 Tax=unclassified Nocardia TaxID=2637762 RepID=UPI0036830245
MKEPAVLEDSGISETVVVIGTGQAGADTATALRLDGFRGPIVMIGEEPSLPYYRPPLSKAYLKGASTAEDLLLRGGEIYDRERIEVRTGVTAVSLDVRAHEVLLSDGDRVGYDRLVLATGGRPRRLDRPDLTSAPNVHTLRTLADATALREHCVPGARAVVLGAGYIGLEFAASATQLGVAVTVLEVAPRVLARVTSPVVSEFFQRVHREEGVRILLEARIERFVTGTSGEATAVELADGTVVETDFILLGVGIAPRTELAEAAGLEVDNGIVVDEFLRTSDPDIFAVGDVARFADMRSGGSRRLESVPNASEHARCVAAAITGKPRALDALPWFWSDQFDLKLKVAGLAEDCDRIVVRRDPAAGRRLTVLYLREDVVVAADVINHPADFATAKRLIAAGRPIDPARAADPDIALKDCGSEALAG